MLRHVLLHGTVTEFGILGEFEGIRVELRLILELILRAVPI
jgi:hypothetical protein